MDEDDLTHPEGDPPSATDEVRQFFQFMSYLGPLPPPDMLEAYERILPGAAKRIFDRLERQVEHRHWAEKAKLQADIAAQRKGQVFGFLIAMAGLGGGFALIWNGSSGVGLALFIATLASFASVFVVGKVKQSKALEKQRLEAIKLLPHSSEEGVPAESEGLP